MKARWQESRCIQKHLVITGELRLKTPAHFGNGEAVSQTDMPLARDAASGRPLLTGTSIAGAARAYLRDLVFGFEVAEPAQGGSLSQILFGDVIKVGNNEESRESYLIVDDAIADRNSSEIRPSVSIDPATRLARVDPNSGRGQLYDIELIEAGTIFRLRFELSLPADPRLSDQLRQGMATALTGFEKGEIGLGMRKRRGYGECEPVVWDVWEYDLTSGPGLLAWLKGTDGKLKTGSDITQKLGTTLPQDFRKLFTLRAIFHLDSSLLIRSGSGGPDDPDMIHLRSQRKGKDQPILPGTSLAGAMRARALRIALSQGTSENAAHHLVEEIFGPFKVEGTRKSEKWASRAVIKEQEIDLDKAYERVQSRVCIDRFTGGSYPGALFDQQPLLGGAKTCFQIEVILRNPRKAHIGILLQILKDLWTSDLPLGGEASVGRGRLSGLEATLEMQGPEQEPESWQIFRSGEDGRIQVIGNYQKLQSFSLGSGGVE